MKKLIFGVILLAYGLPLFGAGIVTGTLSGGTGGGGSATVLNQLLVSGTTNGMDGIYTQSKGFTDSDINLTHYEPIYTNSSNGGWVSYVANNTGFKSWAIQVGPPGGGLIYVNGGQGSNSVPPTANWTNAAGVSIPITITLVGAQASGGANGVYGGVAMTNGNLTVGGNITASTITLTSNGPSVWPTNVSFAQPLTTGTPVVLAGIDANTNLVSTPFSIVVTNLQFTNDATMGKITVAGNTAFVDTNLFGGGGITTNFPSGINVKNILATNGITTYGFGASGTFNGRASPGSQAQVDINATASGFYSALLLQNSSDSVEWFLYADNTNYTAHKFNFILQGVVGGYTPKFQFLYNGDFLPSGGVITSNTLTTLNSAMGLTNGNQVWWSVTNIIPAFNANQVQMATSTNAMNHVFTLTNSGGAATGWYDMIHP